MDCCCCLSGQDLNSRLEARHSEESEVVGRFTVAMVVYLDLY